MSSLKDISITIGSCGNDTTRKEREIETTDLWNKLVSNGSYLSTHLVLGESYNLYREALNCYGTCANMASAIMCRSTLEAALYKFVTAKDLQWRTEEDGRGIYTYRYSECAPYLEDYNKALNEMKSSYPDLFKEINKDLKKVREEGNFAAHYIPVSGKKHIEAIKTSSQTVKLWIDKKGALQTLESTVDILIRFAGTLEKSRHV